MKTPYLDEKIEVLRLHEAQHELTERGEEMLTEFKKIKEALTLGGVGKTFYCQDESYHKIDKCKKQCVTCLMKE